jgi:hypothetical protein
MTVANTGTAPTGPMTLEQGFASLKAKMAETGAKADDQTVKLNEDETGYAEENPEGVTEETTPAPEENAEAVSDDASADAKEEPDDRPVILPDGSQITVEEARKGYLRQADFTQKTQRLAAERDNLASQHNVKMQAMDGLLQRLESLQETEPTSQQWAEAARTMDPKEFLAAKEYWQGKKATMTEAARVRAEHQTQAMRAAKAKAFGVLNEGQYNPDWKDQNKLSAGLDQISEYLAKTYQMDDQTIHSITDPAAIIIADKARRFDELEKAKPKAALAVKGKPAPFKPGAKSTTSPQQEAIRQAQERFTKNPTPDNAVLLHKAKGYR